LDCAHTYSPRNAEIPSQIEKLVLDVFQLQAYASLKIFGKQQAKKTVQFVYHTDSLDAGRVFQDASTVSKACGAVVAGTRVNFCQALTHYSIPAQRISLINLYKKAFT
jgi:hypothetical protein